MANITGRWLVLNPVVQSMDQPSTHQQFSGRDDQPTPTMSMVHPIENRQSMTNFKIWQNGKNLSNFKIFVHRNRRIYHRYRHYKWVPSHPLVRSIWDHLIQWIRTLGTIASGDDSDGFNGWWNGLITPQRGDQQDWLMHYGRASMKRAGRRWTRWSTD